MKTYLKPLILLAGIMACSPDKTPNDANAISKETSVKSFPYIAPAPENGTLKGVVELGGDGFNAFVVEIDTARRWKLKKADFGVSEVYENNADATKVKEGLQKYIGNMLAGGVAAENIHFIQSSTASKNDRVIMINDALKEIGYYINNVSDTLEAKYGYVATLPGEFAGEAFFVDMGSGNTKVAWMENGQLMSFSTYGSKYYVKGSTHETVYAEVKRLMSQIPAENLKKCFIIGGGPYQLASKSKAFNERYAILSAPDKYTADSQKMECTLNIYKAMYETTTNPCEVIFDWDSNFSIGFLLSL